MKLRASVARAQGSSEDIDEVERQFRLSAASAGFSEAEGTADVAAVLVLTGGTERDVLRFSEGARVVLLFYHSSYNSFAAASEAAALLGSLGASVWLYDWTESSRVLRQAARAADSLTGLRGLTITSFGGPSEWLVYSDGSGDLLGARVNVVPLEDLVRDAKASPAESYPLSPTGLEGVSEGDVQKALSLLAAMRRLSKGPLTVRCFDLLRAYGVTPCLPLAILNSLGTPAGCEGDVPSLLTMYILSSISGRAAWMGNVTPGPEPGTIGIAHCTFPLSETPSYSLVTHFETGKPLAVRAEVKEGQVATIAKYDARTRTLRSISARVRLGTTFTRACRTQVAFSVSEDALRLFLSKPMGAHYAVVFDDVRPGLRVFSGLAGVKLEEA